MSLIKNIKYYEQLLRIFVEILVTIKEIELYTQGK